MLIDDDLESCRRVISPAFVDGNGAVVGFPVHRQGDFAFWREYVPAEAVVYEALEGGLYSVCLTMPRTLWVVADVLREFFPDVYNPELFLFWLWDGRFIRFSGPEYRLSTE